VSVRRANYLGRSLVWTGVAYSASCAVIEFAPPNPSRSAMVIGAAVVTNMRATVDHRAPNAMLRVTPAATDTSQMPMMSCDRERFVNVISTLLGVGFERKPVR
jgi:hypothetical protein